MTRDEEMEQFIERQRALGRFYVVQITNHFFEVELEKFLRANECKFSVPILPGETLEQAQKRGSTPSGESAMLNPATQVMFRAGLPACREYMASFVESAKWTARVTSK